MDPPPAGHQHPPSKVVWRTSAESGNDLKTTVAYLYNLYKSPLFRLPPELRTRIYEYAFKADNSHIITASRDFPEPALLRTCSAVRREATGLCYAVSNFTLATYGFDQNTMDMFTRKKRAVRDQFGATFNHVQIQIHVGRDWRRLKSWARAVHRNKMRFVRSTEDRLTGLAANTSPENIKIVGLLRLAKSMHYAPWESIEGYVDAYRADLIALHTDWALDHD